MSESEDERLIVIEKLRERCIANDVCFDTGQGAFTGSHFYRIGFKSGPNRIWETYRDLKEAQSLLSIEFEKYIFSSDFVALCSHKDNSIEFAVRPATEIGLSQIYRHILGVNVLLSQAYIDSRRITLDSPAPGFPSISFGTASDDFYKIVSKFLVLKPITIALGGACFNSIESVNKLITKIANSVLFQLEIISDISLIIEKRQTANSAHKRKVSDSPPIESLQYPKAEYDEAPMSLYWYGSSADRMPLIQFLSFYQVLEYYYPYYSGKEARRRIQAILKDPTFRFDQEADISKILSIIGVSHGASFVKESNQLKTILDECVDERALREFFQQNQERQKFFQKKKGVSKYTVPIKDTDSSLKQEVSNRIYDIRCSIVHTKADPNKDNFILLPNSKEVAELTHDIELVRYIARCVLKDRCSSFGV